jgi:cell division septum initiation protein DivIVA
MTRSKKQLENLEDLLKENKELKEINKSLKRELKHLNRPRVSNNSDSLVQAEYEAKNPKKDCQRCGKGIVREIELGANRSILSCNVCDFHKVVKKDSNKSKEDLPIEKEVK